MLRGRRRAPHRRGAAGALLLLVVTSCGGDGTASTSTSVAVTSVPDAAATPVVEDACTLVPAPDVIAATGLDVDEGVPAGDERRRVCTFRTADRAVGITLGIEASGRFEEKAEASRRALADAGDEIDDVGDAALFFFSDEDLPDGVGGALVGVGDLTIDVTLQGLDEAAMRRVSVAVAELAVTNL